MLETVTWTLLTSVLRMTRYSSQQRNVERGTNYFHSHPGWGLWKESSAKVKGVLKGTKVMKILYHRTFAIFKDVWENVLDNTKIYLTPGWPYVYANIPNPLKYVSKLNKWKSWVQVYTIVRRSYTLKQALYGQATFLLFVHEFFIFLFIWSFWPPL